MTKIRMTTITRTTQKFSAGLIVVDTRRKESQKNHTYRTGGDKHLFAENLIAREST